MSTPLPTESPDAGKPQDSFWQLVRLALKKAAR